MRRLALTLCLVVPVLLFLPACASTRVTTVSMTFEKARTLNYDSGIGLQLETQKPKHTGLATRIRTKVTNSAKNDGTNTPVTGYTYLLAGGLQLTYHGLFLEFGHEYYGYHSEFRSTGTVWDKDDDTAYYRAGYRDLGGLEVSATYFPPVDPTYHARTLMLTCKLDLILGKGDSWRNRPSFFVEPSFTTLTVPSTGTRETRRSATFGLGWRF